MKEMDAYPLQAIEMGRKTVMAVRDALIANPRQSDETQEQYADRIVVLVGRKLMREMGIRTRTQD